MAILEDYGMLPPGLLTPEQEAAAAGRARSAGLLNLGLAIAQAATGAPGQRRPGIGQVLAQAAPSGLQAYQQSFDQTLQNALRGMQIQEMQRKRQQEEASRATMRRLSERMTGITPEGALAAPGGQVGPTVERAEMIGQRQQLTPEMLIREAFAEGISPEAQRSLLTAAQMFAPKEPKETFRPITDAERKERNLPENVPYQISSSGKVLEVGQGPIVKNVFGDVSPFTKEAQQLQAREFSEISKSGNTARRTLQDVNKLGGLLEKTGTGFVPALKQIAGEYGIETKGLGDIQAAQAIINRLVPQQRPPGSGQMSDADLALFKQSLPRIINQPGGNKLIVETLKNINNYLIEEGKIAADVLNNKISPQEGYDRLGKLANPLEAFKPTGGGSLQERINAELARRQGAR